MFGAVRVWSRFALAAFVATAASTCACSKREPPREADTREPSTAPSTASAPTSADASAASSAPAVDPRFTSQLVALAWDTKVYDKPSVHAVSLGYLRAGAVVPAAKKSSGNAGCSGGWYAIAPAGYVCVEPANATMDARSDLALALAHRPDFGERLPYMYGIVRRPGPLYGRLPTRAESLVAEPDLDARVVEWLKASGEDAASFRTDYWMRGKGHPAPSPLTLWEEKKTEDVPPWLAGSRIPPGDLSGTTKMNAVVVGATKNHNGLALVDTAVADGRRYGITTDLLFFPVDRMRPIEGSAYKGYAIPKDIDFPFAIVRRDGAAAFALKKGKLEKVRDLPRRSVVKLGRRKQFLHGHLHFQTDDGLWISDQFSSRLDRAKKFPKWAIGTSGHWIDVSIGKQTLVAYEGETAVFATVVSTGEAGLEDPETSKSTKTGVFRIHTKHVTTTMASNVVGEEFELKDIPYVQYFEAGYALHAAYWHDDFGTPRSHGCINLSPEDAKWLFEWTEPKVPPGWHGARQKLTGSTVFVHP